MEDDLQQFIAEEPSVLQTALDFSLSQVKPKGTLSVLSLFSGGGGLDLGLEGGFLAPKVSIANSVSEFIDHYVDERLVRLKKTKFKTVFANDISSDAKNIWINNFAKSNYEKNNFNHNSIVDLVKLAEFDSFNFPKDIDVVTGGFPCQDFSLAGKRRGLNSLKSHDGKFLDEPSLESRGFLYLWMKKTIEITKPKIFIAENVKGLTNLTDVFKIIKQDFKSINGSSYHIFEPKVLHSANYGISQSRERVFFIGVNKDYLTDLAKRELAKDILNDYFNPYPKPTHNYNTGDSNMPSFVKLADIIGHLPEPDFSSDPSHKIYSKAKFMGKHCQGQNEVDLKSISPTIRAEHHGNIEFRRLGLENGGKKLTELESGLLERRLTPRECGLIQSFPEDFIFVNSDKNRLPVSGSGAYKVIGNAVPPLLGYHLAKRIESLWDIYFGK